MSIVTRLRAAGRALRTPETRESGYTGLIVAGLEARAGGSTATPAATAAVEGCAGWWARGLCSGRFDPGGVRTAGIDLDLIGYRLAMRGEYLARIDTTGGMLRLIESGTGQDIRGLSSDPTKWSYTLVENAPDGGAVRVDVPAASVVHIRLRPDALSPWRGVAPWAGAGLDADTLAGIMRQARGSARAASVTVIPIPDMGDATPKDADGKKIDPAAQFRMNMAQAADGTMTAATTAGGWGNPSGAPAKVDFSPVRIETTDGPRLLRRDLAESILSCYGVPPVLMRGEAAGASLREGWRILLRSVASIGDVVAAELRVKLGMPALALRWPPMADTLMSRTKAASELVALGVQRADALRRVGL